VFVVLLLASSCSFQLNRIIQENDPYKQQQTYKLKQVFKGYPAERRQRGIFCYQVHSQLVHSVDASGASNTIMDLWLKKQASVFDLEPVIFFNIDGEIFEVKAFDSLNKDYVETSSSETSTTTTEDADDEDDKKKTTVTHETSTSNQMYQLMRVSVIVPPHILEKMTNAREINYRIYLGREGINVKPDYSDRNKLREFVRTVL